LAWNRIRRKITRELDTRIADWREDALNTLLSDAWERYVAALATGELVELEAEYTAFVDRALDAVLPAVTDALV
jgi:hypothetical protein